MGRGPVRTTIDLDEEVLLAVTERARREGRTAGAVLSELARQVLTLGALPTDVDAAESFCGFQPLPHRGGVVSNELVDCLREGEPAE